MMGFRGAATAVLLALAGLAATGCGGDLVHGNPPLGIGGDRAGREAYTYATLSRHTDPAENSDEILIFVALSGGGTRAAALGFGVLEALNAAAIRVPGYPGTRPVLKEIDFISSNSGGSFLAAYFAINREAMFAADATGRTRFERDFLKRDLSHDLLDRLINDLPRINSSAVNRSDIAAELYDRTIFAGRTYGDLIKQGRPYLVINAQDTTKGARFEFTQTQFDLICSDLSPFPLSRAITASSAVHGIFAPIKLRNHPRERCPPEPAWIAPALRGEGDPASALDTPRQRLMRARLARWYRDKLPEGVRAPPGSDFYVHLGDGGTADNLGVRAPIFALGSRDAAEDFRRRMERGAVKAVMLIIVNAANAPDPLRDADPGGPTIVQMIRDAADGLVQTVTEDSLRDASVAFALLREQARKRGNRPAFYGPVLVDFEGMADPAARACFKRIETSFVLPPDQVDALRDAGRRLIAAAPEFRRFLHDHGGTMRALAPVPGAARFCPERLPQGPVAAR